MLHDTISSTSTGTPHYIVHKRGPHLDKQTRLWRAGIRGNTLWILFFLPSFPLSLCLSVSLSVPLCLCRTVTPLSPTGGNPGRGEMLTVTPQGTKASSPCVGQVPPSWEESHTTRCSVRSTLYILRLPGQCQPGRSATSKHLDSSPPKLDLLSCSFFFCLSWDPERETEREREGDRPRGKIENV